MTIGVAFSTTPAGHAALRLAAREAAVHQTDLIVLNVTDSAEHADDPEAAATVHSAVEQSLVEGSVPRVVWSVASDATQGSLAAALIGLAELHNVELLVIGSRPRSAVSKLIMGSTVRQVVMDAPMPVVVVKPDV